MPAPAPEAARARMQEAAPTIAPAPAPAVAPVARSSPQTEKAIADTSTSGIQYAAPTASAPAAVATAPRVLAAPAPAARALIASPDKLFQAIEAKDDAALRQTLSQGASPNANASARPDGNPALTQAVMQRWADGVRILLAAGANREAKNKKGHTAADVALELGYSDMAELLAISR